MRESGSRRIRKLSEDTFILTDSSNTSDGGKVAKAKLVRLNPRDLSWTSTHISGPLKHSQFLYRIVPEGNDGSRLDFIGLQLEPRAMSKSEAAALARKVRKEDSTAWRHLAKAMEKDSTLR